MYLLVHTYALLELCDKRRSSGKLDSVRAHRPRKRGTDLEALAYFISPLILVPEKASQKVCIFCLYTRYYVCNTVYYFIQEVMLVADTL